MKERSKSTNRQRAKRDGFDVAQLFADLSAGSIASASDLPPSYPPTWLELLESLLKRALADNEQASNDALADHGAAAKELYLIAAKAVQAIAVLAERRPEALRGIARHQIYAFIPYDGNARAADVDGWLKLIELGGAFRQSRRKRSSSANQVLHKVATDGLHELLFWRGLKWGNQEVSEFTDVNELDAALVLRAKQETEESEWSFTYRKAYEAEFLLRQASKSLPEPKRTGRSWDLWERALLAWVKLKHGGDQWHKAPVFDGIASGRDHVKNLRKQLLSAFAAMLK